MSLNDPLANTLSKIMNAERIGRKEVSFPSSKLIKKALEIMRDNHYIGDFEEIKTIKGNFIKLNLIGKINKCNVIKPRFAAKKDGFEKFEKRYLLAKDFGIIMVSTPNGLMIHTEAKSKGFGGRLIAYVY